MRKPFSPRLEEKIRPLEKGFRPIQFGPIAFANDTLLAPMAAISTAPYRLLMQDMGSGGSVSELISASGIVYNNEKTHRMLKIDPREKMTGIQLFGDDPDQLRTAAAVAEGYGAKFIDINMGCPVPKVVKRGGGAALMRAPETLIEIIRAIRQEIKVPLTLKMRLGWDENELNASELIKIAAGEGITYVAIHGRTRCQQYRGNANWDMIEQLAINSEIPIIGNGDLHTPGKAIRHKTDSHCEAFMLGRGPLRNPFIFFETHGIAQKKSEGLEYEPMTFSGADYWEVIMRMFEYFEELVETERHLLIQTRKLIVWMITGFPHAIQFRNQTFETENSRQLLEHCGEFFDKNALQTKFINYENPFMAGGHG